MAEERLDEDFFDEDADSFLDDLPQEIIDIAEASAFKLLNPEDQLVVSAYMVLRHQLCMIRGMTAEEVVMKAYDAIPEAETALNKMYDLAEQILRAEKDGQIH